MILWDSRDAYNEGDFGLVLVDLEQQLRDDGHLAAAANLRLVVDNDLENGRTLKTLSVRQGTHGNEMWYGNRCLGPIE